jgi:plastocyanin
VTLRRAIALCAVTAWLAVACKPPSAVIDPTRSSTVTAAPTATPALNATPAPSRGAVIVEAAEQYFNPELVTVSAGTTVLWKDVQGTHDMVADDRSFASAVLFEGGTFTHTFSQPGRYRYVCTLHLGAGMWAEVDVD